MFLTITFSPSVDLIIQTQDFEINQLNRYKNFNIFPGGKGINASVILNRMGFTNQAISFFDNDTFNNLASFWQKENLNIINIANNKTKTTRYNVKMFAENASFFELNGPKNEISNFQKNKLKKILNSLNKNDFVYILGVVEEELLTQICEILKKKQVKFGLDIDTNNIEKFLAFEPYFYKPNIDELRTNFKLTKDDNILQTLKQIQAKGSKNILLSLGQEGCILLDEKQNFYKSWVETKIKVKSTVGAGDTLGSVFIANYLKTKNVAKSLILASACASSTVSQWWLTKKKEALSFKKYIKIKKLKNDQTNKDFIL
ncbi:PfkB family carbohydrate kinase [Mesomycoplasma hyorhinis]|uniref:1-phosphofructokinase n=1 Tax=Mesomycoplasma hyorhinis (strain MCLD) TaxID=936139 RepID=A0ABM5M6N5_MESHM|nr:1-phosphofructokinase [Mesomycoplasma hyorhinis MCLD]